MNKPIVLPESIEQLPIDSLVPYAKNSRVHSPEQIKKISQSIADFGFTNPVLIDEHGTIIAGHGRVIAAQQIGMQTVPCIRLTHLSDAQRRAYVIADNRIAELSEWDSGLLASEIEDLVASGIDFDSIGFDASAIDDLVGGNFSSQLVSDADMPMHTEPSNNGGTAPDEPTADDYADIGQGVQNGENKASPILYPVLVQLKKGEYEKFCKMRGKRTAAQALLDLIDMAEHFAGEWEQEKLLRASGESINLGDQP